MFRPGPLFGNLVLADEINRASPKTQSALLEAMQERQVTVMGEVHPLPTPFFVLATQNPIELEGTYPLPEAQLDRFLFKLEVTRSSVDVIERIVLERELGAEPTVAAVLSCDELLEIMEIARRVYLPEVVASYIARLVDATHAAPGVKFGASPRAATALAAASRARALLDNRLNTSFEDVARNVDPVLSHLRGSIYASRSKTLRAQTGCGASSSRACITAARAFNAPRASSSRSSKAPREASSFTCLFMMAAPPRADRSRCMFSATACRGPAKQNR